MFTHIRYVVLLSNSDGEPHENNLEKLMELARSEAEKGYAKMMEKDAPTCADDQVCSHIILLPSPLIITHNIS